MEIVGQQVSHKTLGVGVIISYYGMEENGNNYILVRFESKESRFPFPKGFEKTLSSVDAEFDAFVKEELSKISQRSENVLHDATNIDNANIDTMGGRKKTAGNKTEYTPTMTYNGLLKFGKECGTNSKAAYLDCCMEFGWDETQKGNFGRQGALLYAKNATPEGYSPWFLSHHDLHQTKAGIWKNKIRGELGEYIYEEWDSIEGSMWGDISTRVVFLKLNGVYHFFGVYKFDGVERENNKYTKKYRRISKQYPID